MHILRSLFALIAGFLSWVALCIAMSASLTKLFPQLFYAEGLTDDWRIFTFSLIASIFYSLIAGYICAHIAEYRHMLHVIILSLILFGFAIYLQSQYWDLMPMWFHIPFLALIIPCTILGGDLRIRNSFKVLLYS